MLPLAALCLQRYLFEAADHASQIEIVAAGEAYDIHACPYTRPSLIWHTSSTTARLHTLLHTLFISLFSFYQVYCPCYCYYYCVVRKSSCLGIPLLKTQPFWLHAYLVLQATSVTWGHIVQLHLQAVCCQKQCDLAFGAYAPRYVLRFPSIDT